jgi:6-phosphogluconolactonase
MALQLILAQDEDTFLKKAAQLIMESSVAAIERGGVFTIAFSGGQTPRKLFSLLADSYYRDRINWTKTHVFWGDERFVPPNHPDSNYKMAFDTLLSKVPCPAANIHRIPAEMESAVDAARAYEQSLKLFFRSVMVRNPSAQNQVETSLGDIFPRFDLILLGVGEDGHTASLFPGTSALSEKRKWVTAVHVEKVGGDIVTDVVVIARVSNLAEDSTSIALTFNKGQDWLVRLGMMESALLIERDVYRVRSLEYGDE